MNAKHRGTQDGLSPLRTTLLELVQSLTDEDLTPDEVVQTVHRSIDAGRVVLIGNFRGGLGAAAQVHAELQAPARRRNPLVGDRSDPSRNDSPPEPRRK